MSTIQNPQQWQVYIVQTVSGRLYTGITTDIERRFRQHLGELKGGAKFFRSDPAKQIVYSENKKNRSDATRREMEIKRYSRAVKLSLIDLNHH